MKTAPWAILHLQVRDARTRELLPARIHLKRRDGSCFLPPEEQERRQEKTRAPQ